MSAAALQETQSIQVHPLSAHIGAEIHGVDLTQKLDTRQVAEIRAALLKWRVVFFREQFLTHEQHVAFSAQFGELTVGHPVFGHVEGHPGSIRSPSTARPRVSRGKRCNAPGPAGIRT